MSGNDYLNDEQLARAVALGTAASAFNLSGTHGHAGDLIAVSQWLLEGAIEDTIISTEQEGEGWLYDFEDLEAQDEGTIILDQDGDALACNAPQGAHLRWVYVDPKPGQISKTMSSGEVVFEGKGPWRIVEPTTL